MINSTRISYTVNNMGRVVNLGRISSDTRRFFLAKYPQHLSVRVVEGRKHLSGRGYARLGTEGISQYIIQLAHQSVVIQNYLQYFSNLLRIMNNGTVPALRKVLRTQFKMFTSVSAYSLTTIIIHKFSIIIRTIHNHLYP